jgi:hypothetical protein
MLRVEGAITSSEPGWKLRSKVAWRNYNMVIIHRNAKLMTSIEKFVNTSGEECNASAIQATVSHGDTSNVYGRAMLIRRVPFYTSVVLLQRFSTDTSYFSRGRNEHMPNERKVGSQIR